MGICGFINFSIIASSIMEILVVVSISSILLHVGRTVPKVC
jgi:hypothetical protein